MKEARTREGGQREKERVSGVLFSLRSVAVPRPLPAASQCGTQSGGKASIGTDKLEDFSALTPS